MESSWTRDGLDSSGPLEKSNALVKVRTNCGFVGKNLEKLSLKKISDFQNYEMHSFQSQMIGCLLGAGCSVEPESPLLSALSLKNIISAMSRVRTLDCFLSVGKALLNVAP